MKRLFLVLMMMLYTTTAQAGTYEDALKTYDKVFLYLYTPECGYCTKFTPIYNRLLNKYSDECKFLKINANTEYGRTLARQFRIRYVPYVALIKSRTGQSSLLPVNCMVSFDCADDIMRGFVR